MIADADQEARPKHARDHRSRLCTICHKPITGGAIAVEPDQTSQRHFLFAHKLCHTPGRGTAEIPTYFWLLDPASWEHAVLAWRRNG